MSLARAEPSRHGGKGAVYHLTAEQQTQLDRLTIQLASEYASAESPAFLPQAAEVARGMPEPLVRFLGQWRTSKRWQSAHLGTAFGWRTLQDGRVLHDMVPIPGREGEQTGHSSQVGLVLHTEDAVQEQRCDYLGLMALRNHDGVATTVASLDAGRLSGPARSVLAQPRFLFRPDDEHLRNSPEDVRQDAAAPVLFGAPDHPYLRVDPPYMSAVDGDEEAAAGLRELTDALERDRVSLRLQPGDVLFVDNFQVVHGRPSFTARYDGTDRWLRRVLVARPDGERRPDGHRSSRSRALTGPTRSISSCGAVERLRRHADD